MASSTTNQSPTSGGATMRRNGGGRRNRPPKAKKECKSPNVALSSPQQDARPKTSISNRLYMAPKNTFRTSNNSNQKNSDNAYGGGAEGSSGAIKSGSNNTRRRRRGSGTQQHLQMHDNSNNNGSNHNRHALMAARGAGGGSNRKLQIGTDKSPTMVERQESDNDDASLDAMAAVLVADRDGGVAQLPPAPILWADGSAQRHHASPRMTMRKKMEQAPEMSIYNNSGNSPAASTSKNKMALHYGHEDFSEGNTGGDFNDSFAGCDFDPSELTSSINHAPPKGSSSKRQHQQQQQQSAAAAAAQKKHRNWLHSLWWWWSVRLLSWRGGKDKKAVVVVTTTATTAAAAHPFSLAHCAQFSILLILAVLVYDSHSKVQSHKNQLREYDEERSHILEQMMWIDKAAKKVHRKYSEKDAMAGAVGMSEEDEAAGSDTGVLLQQARQDLLQIQHAIQLNAREHLALTFGEKPAEVSLQISADDPRKLLIGLSDDTPHAISTLVQQVKNHWWDEIQTKTLDDGEGVMELRSKKVRLHQDGQQQQNAAPSLLLPRLEFVERSHGCRTVGSVALRQEQDDEEDEPSLVLAVRLQETESSLSDGSVCIGQVLQGMDVLPGVVRAE